MANEVEIIISGKDRSGPAMASARARAQQTGVQIRQSLARSGRDGGRDAGDGIRDGIESGTRRGGRIVGGFTDDVLKSFGRLGPGMSALITAGVYAAAASAAPAAGLITLALGGALTGIGAVSAAQSVKVRREWSDVGHDLKAGLADVAQPMERSAMRAATVTRTTFGQLKPFLSDFFKSSAPAVDRFVASIGSGLASLGPALVPLRRGYTAVLDAISNRSPQIFGNLEQSLENIGEIAEEHADDIAGAFEAVTSAVEGTTVALGWLADEWSSLTSDVDSGYDSYMGWGRDVAKGIYEAYKAIGIYTDGMKEQEKAWAAADAAAANNGGVKDATAATTGLGGAAGDAAAGLRDLKAEMEALTGPALDAAEAQIRYEEAVDRAAEAAGENGRTLDVNTEKGRANKEALIGIARAAQDHIAAMQAEEQSTGAITAKYGEYRGALMRAARQAGLTKVEAERLANAWLAMPEQVVTHARGNLSDLESKIAAAKAKLKDPGLTRPQRTAIRAEISDLQRKVAAAKASLSSIKSRSVSVFINQIYRSSGIGVGTVLAPGRAHGGIVGGLGGVKRFATGGVAGAGSSLAMVGEQGPELVRLPVGSGVMGAGQTRAMMDGGFGSISMAFRSAAQSSGLGGSGGLGDSLREIVSFREALEKLSSSLIGQTRAVSAYEAAWDAAGRALKENGRTLSLSTEKGRENRGSLIDLAEAAREVVIAMQAQGRSSSTLLATMKEQRSEFISMARRMGLSKSAASAMADRMGLTTAGVRSALAASSGKASGGPAGGWTMVGERGPELVRLPFGSQVTTANQTAAVMTGGGQAGPIVLEVRGGDAEFSRFMAQWIRRFVHAKGGNVQTAFGRS